MELVLLDLELSNELQSEIEILSEDNRRLQTEVVALREENKRLASSNEDLFGRTAQFSHIVAKNKRLEKRCEKLTTEMKRLVNRNKRRHYSKAEIEKMLFRIGDLGYV